MADKKERRNERKKERDWNKMNNDGGEKKKEQLEIRHSFVLATKQKTTFQSREND